MYLVSDCTGVRVQEYTKVTELTTRSSRPTAMLLSTKATAPFRLLPALVLIASTT